MAAEQTPSRPTGAAITTTTLSTLKRLLQLSPDAMLLIDARGVIALANPQVSVMFGYAQEHLHDLPVEQLLPKRMRVRHQTHRSEYMDAPGERPMGIGLDLVGLRQDGSEFPVDISLRPFHVRHQL